MPGVIARRTRQYVLLLIAIALLTFPLPTVATPPEPGKRDTFELDRYLRRNAHPLTVKLITGEAAPTNNVPVTMAVGCGEGDYAIGKMCPVLNGKRLPAQVDVLATWPTDGSIRHAIVTVIVPEIQAGEIPTLEFRSTKPPEPPKFVLTASLDDWSAGVQLSDESGEVTRSSIPTETIAGNRQSNDRRQS